MKVRILHRGNEGVSVVYPAPKSRREDETEEQWLERIFTKATPSHFEYKDIDTDIEPLPSRRFRGAWSKGTNGKSIETNLDKAKIQVLEELRRERNKELTKTDGLMAKANETGTPEEIDTMKAHRQKLRDLPTTIGIEQITTVEELQAKFPVPEININEL